MNIEGIDRQRRLSVSETVEINISHNEARRTTIRVFVNPLEIALNRYGRSTQSMEHGIPL